MNTTHNTASTELGIINSSIDTYHGAIKQIATFRKRAINAIIWYERTIFEYHNRIQEKDLQIEQLDKEKSEYYKLLALAINRKYSIEGGEVCQ